MKNVLLKAKQLVPIDFRKFVINFVLHVIKKGKVQNKM